MEKAQEDKKESRPRRGNRRLHAVLLFLVAMNAGFGLAVYFLEPTPVFADLDLAEDFMRAIEVGNDDAEDGVNSGYAVAYELLDEDFRKKTPFPEFLNFFDEQVRSHGFIQTSHRHKREYGHYTARKVRFEVEYGGIDDEPTIVVYELMLTESAGSFGISGYSLVSTSKKSD